VLDGRKSDLFPVLPRWQHNVWIFDNNVISELRGYFNSKDKERYQRPALVYVTVNERNKLFIEDGNSDPEVVAKAQAAWARYEAGEDQPQGSEPQAGKPPF
jgi:hypothetical protein